MQDAGMSQGWHFVVATYDGTGGASAANGITLYIDGVLVAGTATNNASYVAMNNEGSLLYVGAQMGSGGSPSIFWKDDMGFVFMENGTLDEAAIKKIYQATKMYYGL